MAPSWLGVPLRRGKQSVGVIRLVRLERRPFTPEQIELVDLLADIRSCRHCEPELPLGANPVVRASATARVLIVGQAPGTRVHETSVPWNDPSGERLRSWLADRRARALAHA